MFCIVTYHRYSLVQSVLRFCTYSQMYSDEGSFSLYNFELSYAQKLLYSRAKIFLISPSIMIILFLWGCIEKNLFKNVKYIHFPVTSGVYVSLLKIQKSSLSGVLLWQNLVIYLVLTLSYSQKKHNKNFNIYVTFFHQQTS